MEDTQKSQPISTKLLRIAHIAKQCSGEAINTLHHFIDLEWMKEAFRRTRKSGAPGIDNMTGAEYEKDLEKNLGNLLTRFKSGSYRAPHVKEVLIPKSKPGEWRKLGLPTFEDKVLQRAVLMVLEAVYEPEFYEHSYGFRPKRSAHQCLKAVEQEIWSQWRPQILELDIRKCFDSIPKDQLMETLRKRINDGVILRTIGKWLNAGIMNGSSLHYNTTGCPQGSVISPLLMNIYLNEVLDQWYVDTVRPRLEGSSLLVRFADDSLFIFEKRKDAERVLKVLNHRFARYGLTLHPEKTGLINFTRHQNRKRSDSKPPTFDFLGFTHYWGRSRRGKPLAKKKTAKDRLKRSLQNVNNWCKRHRHLPVVRQHQLLGRKLQGHYQYFGVSHNGPSLTLVYRVTERLWQKWLNRRCQKRAMPFTRFRKLLQRYPLPKPRIVHGFDSSFCERFT
jgi:group II intron reverse transcriptase/maturase